MLFIRRCRLFRWNATRINVDMHDVVQSTTSVFHTRIATRMAAGPHLYFRRLHLHHDRNHIIGVKQLGSRRHTICSLGRIHSDGAILLGCCHLPTRFSRRWDWRTTVPIAQFAPSWIFLHHVCVSTMDNCDFRTICWQSLSSTFLIVNLVLPSRNVPIFR